MKVLFVSSDGSTLSMAMRMQDYGHDIKFWIKSNDFRDVGLGLVPRVDSFSSYAGWADLIIFDDAEFGQKAKEFRAVGKAVVGGTPLTDRLEMDRSYGQTMLEHYGVKILPHTDYKSVRDAISYLTGNPGRYVVKLDGKMQDDKSLSYVGKDDDGEDMLTMLEHYDKKYGGKIDSIQLQTFVKGTEVAISGFFNGHDFIEPIQINFEHKKLMNGDIGPATGEMGTTCLWSKKGKFYNKTIAKFIPRLALERYVGNFDINCIVDDKGEIWPLEFTCFDEKTEILTQDGWKKFDEIKIGDMALSINPEDRNIQWKEIVNLHVSDYEGDMVQFGKVSDKNSALDILVTPEHKMLVNYAGKDVLQRADSISTYKTHVVRFGKWFGFSPEFIEIPAYIEKHRLGKHNKGMDIIHPSKKIETSAWMEFIGLYLAEGSSNGHQINISQSVHGKRTDIRRILSLLPFSFKESDRGFEVSSIQLVKFFENLGLLHKKCNEKSVPKEYLDFNKYCLSKILNGFRVGDGSIHKRTGQVSVYTTSKVLADNLQEIIIKCGDVANIKMNPVKGTSMKVGNGKKYIRNHNGYSLSIRKQKKDYSLDGRNMKKTPYSGKIWDVEVKDFHTMLVRRNGKPFFSGNCRFGYPDIFLKMEGMDFDLAKFFYGLATGSDKKIEIKNNYSCGLVVGVPPYPFISSELFKKMSEGMHITLPDEEDGIYLMYAKKKGDAITVAGTYGQPLVVCGSGQYIQEAIDEAYARMDEVYVSNMMYRTDIGEKTEENLKKLVDLGVIEEFPYDGPDSYCKIDSGIEIEGEEEEVEDPMEEEDEDD